MPPPAFERRVTASLRLQNYALNCPATGSGLSVFTRPWRTRTIPPRTLNVGKRQSWRVSFSLQPFHRPAKISLFSFGRRQGRHAGQRKRKKCVLFAANRRLVPRVSILYSIQYVDIAREDNWIKGRIPQGGRNVLRTCWISWALDCTLWRTRYGRGYGPVARQNTQTLQSKSGCLNA
jgi:hypothetical protein